MSLTWRLKTHQRAAPRTAWRGQIAGEPGQGFQSPNAFASTQETVKREALGCIRRDLSPLSEQHLILLHSVIQALPLYSHRGFSTKLFFLCVWCIHPNSPNLYILTSLRSNSGRVFTLTFLYLYKISITVSTSRFVFYLILQGKMLLCGPMDLPLGFCPQFKSSSLLWQLREWRVCENTGFRGLKMFSVYCSAQVLKDQNTRLWAKTVLLKPCIFYKILAFLFFPFSYTYLRITHP